MQAIHGLNPQILWRYFQEISKIPRESKQEQKIRAYIIDVAKRLKLTHHEDAAGNIVVFKTGVRHKPTIILQAHMDMVCEKNTDTVHNFDTDPITLVRRGDWVMAEGTTLGADNGIGVAAMLSIMDDASLVHPAIELLFTVDEETGLTGAQMIEPGFISGRTLINLDSDDEKELCIGCAGGLDTHLSLPLSYTSAPYNYRPLRVMLTGLKGGHSGTDIHEGRGNAIKLLSRFLWNARNSIDYHLKRIDGGSKHNAIPRETDAIIFIDPVKIPDLNNFMIRWNKTFAQEFQGIEEDVRIIHAELEDSDFQRLSDEDTRKTVDLLYAIPHGVIRSHASLENSPISSTNLAICGTGKGELEIVTSQRSFIKSSLQDISDQIKAVAQLAGADVSYGQTYPAWKPNLNSPILNTAQEVYRSVFQREIGIKVIHAGLECAVIGEKIPGIDMLSLGPDIEQAHSPTERVHIKSVERFWDFLIGILSHLATG